MKYLKSTLREKKRYVPFTISEETIFESFEKEFNKQFKELLGTEGFAEANPLLIHNLWKSTSGVLRVNHKHVVSSKVALTLIRKIENKKILVITNKVYGTLKKLKIEVK
ncbi:MAG: ribonuclease P protein component 2 [Nanoarchaeota archaeon]|nr:ribonuclease P protein component 2 [Nanoarchaeota archaeon]